MNTIENQHLQPHAVAHNANGGRAASTSQSLLLPPSSAGSSISNGSPQKEAPNPLDGLPSWKRYLAWWPEFAGALLSLLFLTAIVVFLIQIQGSMLEDWHMAWQIQPSTILSILVTLCRITLAFFIAEGIGQLKWVFFEQRPHQLSDFESFDKATRGAWGATCFLWKVNRRALVASFCAVMAVLVLAMDPFSQQVLHYPLRTSNISNAVVMIPSAHLYDIGALYAAFKPDNVTASFDSDPDSSSQEFGDSAGPVAFGSTSRARDTSFGHSSSIKRDGSTTDASEGKSSCSDTLMARAAYAGLYKSVLPFDFTCPSGNCTWPPFTTLGICSECHNITSQVKASCNVGWLNKDRAQNSSNSWEMCWYEMIGPGNLPGNASYPGPLEEYGTSKFRSSCDDNMYWPLWFTWASDVWDKSRDLLSFTSYRFPKNSGFARGNCRLPMAHVEQCSLFWCAKHFESPAVVLGKMYEGPSTNIRLLPFEADNATCPGLGMIEPLERESKAPMQGLIREDKACPQSGEDIRPDDTFWVNKNDHIMTVNMLSPMIDKKQMAVDNNNSTYVVDGAAAGSDTAIMTALWDNYGGKLSLTMADIATAMTNHIRSTDGHVKINGTSTRIDTVVKVTWFWLIYLAAMVVLSLAFFVTAVVFASEMSRVVWKSSSLAVLMHGPEGFDRDELDHRSIEDMGENAKGLWARLEMDDQGSLRLVRHGSVYRRMY